MLFTSPHPRRRQVLPPILVQMAVLAVTGWGVWSLGIRPPLHHSSFTDSVAQAFAVALLAFIGGGMLMLAFQWLNTPRLGSDGFEISLQTARTAIWCAPATVLLVHLSALCLGATVILVVSTTRLLYLRWAKQESASAPLPTRSFRWFRPWTFAAATAWQLTFVGFWADAQLLAMALLYLSSAMVTIILLSARGSHTRSSASWSKSVFQICLTMILAVVLTVGGQGIGSPSSRQRAQPDPKTRTSLLRSARMLMRALDDSDEAGTNESVNELATALYEPPRPVEITDGTYPGVILWPDVKAIQRTITEPLSWLRVPLSPVHATSFQIPFTGQYWMFRSPDDAPPRGSYFRRASPLALSFRTTDGKSMEMKALQKFDHPFDLRCCSAIQVTISNADRYPGTVNLEVLLV